jgi:hypothetical protein
MPDHTSLLEGLIPLKDPWCTRSLSESLRSQPRWRAVTIVAEIESVRDPCGVISDVHPGDVITGSYVYDSAAPDADLDSTCGKYRFSRAPFGVVLNVGSHRFGTDPRDVDFDIDVHNCNFGDQFTFASRNNVCQPALKNGHCTGKVGLISWCLHDFSGTAVSSDDLPSEPLELADWRSIVGMRIEGLTTNGRNRSEESFLIIARVISAEPAMPILTR